MVKIYGVKLKRRELVIIGALCALLLSELFIFTLLIYFAQFPLFIVLFVENLRIISPAFLAANIVAFFLNVFIRGKELIIQSWVTFLWEVLKFTLVSFLMTLAFMIICALISASVFFITWKLHNIKSVDAFIASLRHWVSLHFY